MRVKGGIIRHLSTMTRNSHHLINIISSLPFSSKNEKWVCQGHALALQKVEQKIQKHFDLLEISYRLWVFMQMKTRNTESTPLRLAVVYLPQRGLVERFKPGPGRLGSTCSSTTYWQHDLGQITYALCTCFIICKIEIKSLCAPLRAERLKSENR